MYNAITSMRDYLLRVQIFRIFVSVYKFRELLHGTPDYRGTRELVALNLLEVFYECECNSLLVVRKRECNSLLVVRKPECNSLLVVFYARVNSLLVALRKHECNSLLVVLS
jgi:hypothetical protein